MAALRPRSMITIGLSLFLFILLLFCFRSSFPITILRQDLDQGATPPPPPPDFLPPDTPNERPIPSPPSHKPEHTYDQPPIVDNFPLAALANSALDIPAIPPWNTPPTPHIAENTPLFIGFTRNWPLLQQAVISYITAGWPASDIYIVENTGTMKSNVLGLLSLQNPFFLNYTRLEMLGVNVLRTPTLLTFSQMQNFFLYTALERNWTAYFWGHMDVVVLSYEENYHVSGDGSVAYKSLYSLAVEVLWNATSGHDIHSADVSKPWALRFFSYDRLALVNTAAFEAVGGWDTSIPYYMSDCDMHERLKMAGFELGNGDVHTGRVFDVADSLDDLLVLYRLVGEEPGFRFKGMEEEEALDREREKQAAVEEMGRVAKAAQAAANAKLKITEESPESLIVRDVRKGKTWISDTANSTTYVNLRETLERMQKHKNHIGGSGRNYWQSWQHGGKGDPYYRDPDGFERAMLMVQDVGRDVYAEKWGHKGCNLIEAERKMGDEWRLEKDWE